MCVLVVIVDERLVHYILRSHWWCNKNDMRDTHTLKDYYYVAAFLQAF